MFYATLVKTTFLTTYINWKINSKNSIDKNSWKKHQNQTAFNSSGAWEWHIAVSVVNYGISNTIVLEMPYI